MGLGLIVGVAALGVISARSVVERRQQIGVLRAIGFRRGMVQASFLLESSFVALTAIVVGTRARPRRRIQRHRRHPAPAELVATCRFDVPWLTLALIFVVVYARRDAHDPRRPRAAPRGSIPPRRCATSDLSRPYHPAAREAQDAKSAVAMTVLRLLSNVPSAMPSPTRRKPGIRMTARCSGSASTGRRDRTESRGSRHRRRCPRRSACS